MLKKNLCGLFAALFAAGFAGCGGGPRTYTVVDGTMLGTTLHVVADVEGVSSQELYAAVMELDREAKASMSIFDPASLLSRLNRNETDSVDRHIAFNLRLADSIGALSAGRYDVTVKPLVEAWGFAGKAAQAHPNVDSILDFVGREKVRIERGRLVKSDPRVQLDFNSVAKGYTVDLLAEPVDLLKLCQQYLGLREGAGVGGVDHLPHLPQGGAHRSLQVHDPDIQLGHGQELPRPLSHAVGGIRRTAAHLGGSALHRVQQFLQPLIHGCMTSKERLGQRGSPAQLG